MAEATAGGDLRIAVGLNSGGADAAVQDSAALTALAALFELRPLRIGAIGAAAGGAVDDAGAAALREYAAALVSPGDLCGYVLVDATAAGAGLRGDFVDSLGAALLAVAPLLPQARASQLSDPALRDSFSAQVCTYGRWRQLCGQGLSLPALQIFFARHKYLIMSHHVAIYRQLGRLLAAPVPALPTLAEQMIALIMQALARPASRGGHANALQHIGGYLKRDLDRAARAELSASIERYRGGSVPLAVPLALLNGHFRRHPHPYIDGQVFMQPAADRCIAGPAERAP